MNAGPEISLHHTLGGTGLQDEAAPCLHNTDMAASPTGPSPVAARSPLDESSLLAMLMDNDEMDALEPGEDTASVPEDCLLCSGCIAKI